MSDLIDRQAAIDIERRATVDTNPEHFESHQKFVEFMDDAEISSFGRWQWSNGFNTALTAVGIDLKRLPSAQPEQHWIPCGERLPENDEWVVITVHDEHGDTPFRYTDFGWYLETAKCWIVEAEQRTDVIAWMPLPEPYREEGENR